MTVAIGIAYPRKKKTENKNGDEEDLAESLTKLILDKFDGKKGEFYEWSQTIHNEVVSLMEKLFVSCYNLGY